MIKLIKELIKEEDSVAVKVFQITNGYSVSVWDLDADKPIPSFNICQTEEQAIKKAEEIFGKM